LGRVGSVARAQGAGERGLCAWRGAVLAEPAVEGCRLGWGICAWAWPARRGWSAQPPRPQVPARDPALPVASLTGMW